MRLVIADDEQYIRDMFTEQYSWGDHGIFVEGVAVDGQDAYDMALRVRPDILLTDIRMPRMNGLELMRALKEKLPEVKVVFLTGWGTFEYAREALKLGASDYLVKPCSEQEIMEALKAATGERGAAAAGEKHPAEDAVTIESRKHAIKLACAKIQKDVSVAVSLTEVAEHVNMNPSSFSRLFRQEMGCSFSEYVTQVRMNEAKKLLIESNMKIHEIAKKVGYVSSSHFVQIFGEFTGMTPGRFRETNG